MSETERAPGTILFIDDSRLMRFTAKKSLSGAFEVVLADGGEAAIEAVDGDPAIVAVVTDLMMPDVDGFDVIRHVRASDDPRIRALPIMAVTGSTVEGDRLRALELGADDLMTKPFRPAVLLDRVRRMLAQAAEEAAQAQPVVTDEVEVPAAPNVVDSRVGFVGRLRQAMSMHARQGLPLAVLHVRLGNAAVIEQRLDRNGLNAVMRQVERVLVRVVRVEDTVGRTGVDHCSLLLPATPIEGARILRRRIRSAVGEQRFQVRGLDVPVELELLLHVPKASLDPDALLNFVPGRPAGDTSTPDSDRAAG